MSSSPLLTWVSSGPSVEELEESAEDEEAI